MTPKLLTKYGNLLYGKTWGPSMAALLKTRHDQVRHFMCGTKGRYLPKNSEELIIKELRNRIVEINKILEKLD